MATAIPRSLTEPEGLAPSYLSHTSAPTRSDRRGAGRSGVAPSWRVTTGVPPSTGRKARYSSTTPRQAAATAPPLLVSDDPQQRPHPVHDVELVEVGDGGLHVALGRQVGDEHQA